MFNICVQQKFKNCSDNSKMAETVEKILESVNNCLVPKLSKDYYEKDFHVEYQLRNNTVPDSFEKLKILLEGVNFTQPSNSAPSLFANLLLLYFELKCPGPWNTEQIKEKEYSEQIQHLIMSKHHINLENILQNDSFDCQQIFDKCIEVLHKKMTMQEFKKYPALIEVYCLLLKNVKSYKIKVNPVTVLPVGLMLMDDFYTANKIKGLQSCKAVLQAVKVQDLFAGNYYEVVYNSLKKNLVEKDREVTQALFECLVQFFERVPLDIKDTKLYDVYSTIVDDLYTESNLYRKANYLDFLTKIIDMLGIHCARKRNFKLMIRDNIDICSNQSVDEILLLHVLQCYEKWLKYCWCVWRLCEDHKILSSLFKILYLSKDENTKSRIQILLITLVKLCSKEEQIDILENLDDPLKCSNEDFFTRLNEIKEEIMS